jgi:hypothetical protein
MFEQPLYKDKAGWAVLLFTIVMVVALVIYGGEPILFEDGSFRIYDVSGCIPFQLCS